MLVLGINAYHADASAAILKDGRLIAAVEEERFCRIKHWAGFPKLAIQYCLNEAGARLEDVEHFAISRDPSAHFFKKVLFALRHRFDLSYLKNRVKNLTDIKNYGDILTQEMGIHRSDIQGTLHHVEHHHAHMASSFFVSGFEEAAVVSVDALGDYASTMWALGEDRKIHVMQKVLFPHSLGFLYTAGTQFLGFPKYGDEYKVMGLASYGTPRFLNEFRRMIAEQDGCFKLNLKFFRHTNEGISMSWESGEPIIGKLYSPEWEVVLGPARNINDKLEKRHEDLAASLQAVFEEVYFRILEQAYQLTGKSNLCLAGGCAMNSVANGKIFKKTPFKDIYIQAAAGDAGTAIGAAFYVYHQILNQPRSFMMSHAYWGPQFDDEKIRGLLEKTGLNSQWHVKCILNEEELCSEAAKAISDGKVVGWFQGRMEWGARALGNRSILADPRRKDMKDILNARIKHREAFRPFAPSILEESVGSYFEIDYPDPFMLKVYPIKEEKRELIPAVTHVDGTGRLQTVCREDNPRYWKLIKAFERLTGIPIVLNTSFNENEPIVCIPEEALDCFKRTQMQVLVLNHFYIEKKD